jgi:integrin beta 3
MRGIDEVKEEYADYGRTIIRKVVYSDGKVQETRTTTNMIIHRGVWTKRLYEVGDICTWNGSMWHCEKSMTEAQPGTSPDWKLVVKAGRDGKEGKPGDRGEKGERGPKGEKGNH